MRRPEVDAVSLLAGLLFLVVAGVHIVARTTNTDLSLRWIVPATLVLLGVLGLLSAMRFPRRTAGDPATATGPAERSDVVEPAIPDEADEAASER